jgi:ABC-type branched-subunit amino acid transport system ATPase component
VVHQEPRLFPDLTVAENVFIGHAPSGLMGSIDWRGMRRAAQALFAELDVQFDVGAPVRGLSMADQQLIEIAKALSVDAGALILDEPTASLSAHEVERLFTIVRRLRDRGVAILFVSHRLDEVFALCDRATVFRDGRHVVTAATDGLTTADLIRHMVGRTVSLFPKVENPIGEVLLEVSGLTRVGVFRDVGFSVRAGEIVGLAGLVGAGRSEVAGVLFGLDRRDSGEVRLGGKLVDFAAPSAAMSGGSPTCPRTATRRAWCSLHDRPERDPTDPAAPVPSAPRLGGDRAPGRRRSDGAVQRPDDRRRPGGRGAVGREPAEGRPRQVAGRRAAGPHPRRADARHRHRGQSRGPPPHLRARGIGPRDHPHLERPPGGARDVRPDRRLHEGRVTAEISATRQQERVMFAATGSLATDERDVPVASTGESNRG